MLWHIYSNLIQIITYLYFKAMGNSQSHSQTQFLDDWVQLQKTAVNTGNSHIWANKKNRKIQMEEYPLYVTTSEEVQQQKKIHQFRHNHPQVVSSLYFIDETHEQFCASNYQGKIFLQRIPLTLANVGDIPFPDALHLYSQTLQGFHVLASQVQQGCFPISQQHIGINCNSIVKVWMNTFFQKNYPNRNQRITEQKMVKMILDIVDANVDYQGIGQPQRQSPPVVSRYIYQNSKAPSQVKFNEAINIFRDYVNRFFGGKIPQRMNCVDQVGGSDYLYKSWNQQANKYHNNTQRGEIIHQAPLLDTTRGFTKTSTIPYENANSLNQSYTEFKRQEPIASTPTFNTNQNNQNFNTATNINVNNNFNNSNFNESSNQNFIRSSQQIQQKPLSVPTTNPTINYSPSGFININNNSNVNIIPNSRPSLLNTQPALVKQNQILIRSNVRPVEEPVRKSQIITTIPPISSNANRVSSFRPAIQPPIFVQPQSYQPQTSNINFNNSKPPVLIQQPKPITFQPQISSNIPIRRQFQESIIQNRIVHIENNRQQQSQRNIISQEQNRIFIKNIPAPIIQQNSTGFQSNVNPQRPSFSIPEQQRSIYVPLTSNNVNFQQKFNIPNVPNIQNVPQIQSKQVLPNQTEKNYNYTKNTTNAPISKQPILNQNINPQRVTSQMIVLQNRNNYNSSTSPSSTSYLNKKQQNDRSVYSPNRSGTEELSNSKYDSLKLDDGMSSAAFLNQLKNLKNLSTTKNNFQIAQSQKQPLSLYQHQTYSPSNQQTYKYYNNNQTGYNSYSGSIYQNLNNQQQQQPIQSKYYNGNGNEEYQNQNYNRNNFIRNQNLNEQLNLNNNNNDQIRYEYRYSSQQHEPEYYQEEYQQRQRREYVNQVPSNQRQRQRGNQYSSNQVNQHEYRSYFDKYANLSSSPINSKPHANNQNQNQNQNHNQHYYEESHQVQEEYKVEYDPQILADLRKLHGQK